MTGQRGGNRYLGGVMKFLCLSAAAIAFALASCERHSWEDVEDENGVVTEKGTKRLYKEHEDHAEGHGGHAEEGDQDGDGHSDAADGAHGDAKDGDKGHGEDAEEGAGHDHDGDGKPDHD